MIHPLPVERYLPAQYSVREAAEPWEVAGCRALRRAVFCDEQAIFSGDDTDDFDARATALAAVSLCGGMPHEVVGTVRIHAVGPDDWFGSRLAVQRPLRRVGGLGTQLIRLAVCLAHARGARRFRAHVQAANVPLFVALHWRPLAALDLHGHPHALMQADLAHYPASGARAIDVMRDLPQAA